MALAKEHTMKKLLVLVLSFIGGCGVLAADASQTSPNLLAALDYQARRELAQAHVDAFVGGVR